MPVYRPNEDAKVWDPTKGLVEPIEPTQENIIKERLKLKNIPKKRRKKK